MPSRIDRRTFLASAAGALAALPALGCGGSDALPPPPPTPSVPATVTLQRDVAGAQLSSRFAGLSFEKPILAQPFFRPDNAPLASVLSLLGPVVIRIGANGVDHASWQGAVAGLTAISPTMVDALAAFAGATGTQVIYGINFAQNSPAAAASEAAYVASRLGSSLLAFEIGNEPDLYHGNGARPATWTYADFLTEWRAYATAIRGAVPAAPLCGPASASNLNGYSIPFARDAASVTSLLTHHYYRGDGNSAASTIDLLTSPDPALGRLVAQLAAAAQANGLAGGARLGECNSFYHGGKAGVSNAYASALWVIDFLFACVLNGATGVNLHGGGNGPGYTPIAEVNGAVTGVRPVFHGMLLFSQAGGGMAVPATVQLQGTLDFTAYGVVRTDGGLNAVFVNKDRQRGVDVTLSLGAALGAFKTLALRGPALESLDGVTLGGVAVGTDGRWSPTEGRLLASNGQVRATVPPSSALLLRSV